MATALKDIPFTAPVMAGATSGGGTIYNLAAEDSINEGSTPIIEYGGSGTWLFRGSADYAGCADYALAVTDGSSTLSYKDISSKLDCISVIGGSDTYYFKGGLEDGFGIITFLIRDDGCGQYTPVINIGPSTYDLSVDSNGFVKASMHQ